MIEFKKRSLIKKHPYYRITFLNENDLRKELEQWNREDLISWLKFHRLGVSQNEVALRKSISPFQLELHSRWVHHKSSPLSSEALLVF